MPIVMCKYCYYIGSGENVVTEYNDVLDHEKTCEDNPDYTPKELNENGI